VLTIPWVNGDSIGTYACNASNSGGYVYKSVYLNIISQKPALIEEMGNRTAAVGQVKLKLRCKAKAFPKPEYSWMFQVRSIYNKPVFVGYSSNVFYTYTFIMLLTSNYLFL
jgi:hypothetical protein